MRQFLFTRRTEFLLSLRIEHGVAMRIVEAGAANDDACGDERGTLDQDEERVANDEVHKVSVEEGLHAAETAVLEQVVGDVGFGLGLGRAVVAEAAGGGEVVFVFEEGRVIPIRVVQNAAAVLPLLDGIELTANTGFTVVFIQSCAHLLLHELLQLRPVANAQAEGRSFDENNDEHDDEESIVQAFCLLHAGKTADEGQSHHEQASNEHDDGG